MSPDRSEPEREKVTPPQADGSTGEGELARHGSHTNFAPLPSASLPRLDQIIAALRADADNPRKVAEHIALLEALRPRLVLLEQPQPTRPLGDAPHLPLPPPRCDRESQPILYLEDSNPFYAHGRGILKGDGWTHVTGAPNGEAAFDHFQLKTRNGKPFSVGVFDVHIVGGGMSGPDVARRIWKTNPNFPIVFVSTDPHASIPEGCCLVTKPFSRAALSLAIERAILGEAGIPTTIDTLPTRHLAESLGMQSGLRPNNKPKCAKLFNRFMDRAIPLIKSPRFFAVQTVLIVGYVACNSLWAGKLAFDPYPYIFLNLLFSVSTGYTGFIVLYGQDIKDRHDERMKQLNDEVTLVMLEQLDDMRLQMAASARTAEERFRESLARIQSLEKLIRNGPNDPLTRLLTDICAEPSATPKSPPALDKSSPT